MPHGLGDPVSADMLFGSGLRTTVVTPNDLSLPNYAVVNASGGAEHSDRPRQGTQLRFDAINLFDNRATRSATVKGRRGRAAVRPAPDLPAHPAPKIPDRPA